MDAAVDGRVHCLGYQGKVRLAPRCGSSQRDQTNSSRSLLIVRPLERTQLASPRLSVAVKNGAILAGPAWRPGRFAFGLFPAEVPLVSQVAGAPTCQPGDVSAPTTSARVVLVVLPKWPLRALPPTHFVSLPFREGMIVDYVEFGPSFHSMWAAITPCGPRLR